MPRRGTHADVKRSAKATPPSDARSLFVLVTCEHGGNATPPPFDTVFHGHQRLLESHRGFDAGALQMGQTMAAMLDAPFVAATVSRLVVELNRPPAHAAFHSAIMQRAPAQLRGLAVARYYEPHRRRIDAIVEGALTAGKRVLHIASHSFTPVKNGVARQAEVGLLYDPRRPFERAFCAHWKDALERRAPRWRIRRNYPYRGASAGLTTELRRLHPPERYAGIELEMNQKLVRAGAVPWARARDIVLAALQEALLTPPDGGGRLQRFDEVAARSHFDDLRPG